VGEPAGGRAEGIWHIEVSRSARRQLGARGVNWGRKPWT